MIQLSFSELSCLLRCQWRWFLNYREGLLPVGVPSEPLQVGSAMHEILREGYLSGNMVIPQSIQDGDIVKELMRIVEGYRGQLAEDLAMIEPLATEFPFIAAIPTNTGSRSNYELIGWVDLIARERMTGSLQIWDHKTTKRKPSGPFVDYQLSLYAWAMHRLGLTADTTVLNCIKRTKAIEVDRFTYFKEPKELEAWGSAIYQVCRMRPTPKASIREISKTHDDRCGWDCDYREVCRFHAEGRFDVVDEIVKSDFAKKAPRTLANYQRKLPAQIMRRLREVDTPPLMFGRNIDENH